MRATLTKRFIPSRHLILIALLVGSAALISVGAWRLASNQSAADAPVQQTAEQPGGGAQPAPGSAGEDNIAGFIDILRSTASVEERMRDATAVARVKITAADHGSVIDRLPDKDNRTLEGALPYTRLHVQVLSYFTGDLGTKELIVNQTGGRTIDGLTWVVSGGATQLAAGDEAIAFIWCREPTDCGIDEAYIIEGGTAKSEGDARELPLADLLGEIEAAKAKLGIVNRGYRISPSRP